jgi:NTE family protein
MVTATGNLLAPTMGTPSAGEGPVAFVLAGGASHAAVQVGMLEALTDAGVRPDLVVGTSAGAVNSVAFGADPSATGLSRLAAGWRQAKRSQVFPLWSPTLVLGAVGRSDHILDSRGLAALIRNFIHIELLEEALTPVHVVATDRTTGDAVVLSRGPVLPALLASTAIPAVFAPIEVEERLLIDGGVAADTPTLEAESLGASTIYVLPTSRPGPGGRPGRSAMEIGLSAIGQLLGHSGPPTIAATRRAVVHVVPAPPTAAIRPFDFSQSARLIDAAAELTRGWLTAKSAAASSQSLMAS